MKEYLVEIIVFLTLPLLLGCKKDDTVQPPELTLNANLVNVTVYGESDGAIDLSVSGGEPPYSYQWSDGATTEDRIGITAGTYSVTVTDARGQKANLSIEITQPWHLIVGWWDWFESYVEGERITPETAGFTSTYRFELDSIFYIYIDSLLIDSSLFKVTYGLSPWTMIDSVEIINLMSIRGSWYPAYTVSFLCQDTLILKGIGVESVESKYARIRVNRK